MILSFGDKATEDIYNGVRSKKALSRCNRMISIKAQVKLDMLNRAKAIKDLKSPPNNRLEKLHGDLAGMYSIRINEQYRIIFDWNADEAGASNVKIIDYH